MQFVISITVMQYASVYVSCSCLEVILPFTNKTRAFPKPKNMHRINSLAYFFKKKIEEQTDPLFLTNLKLTQDNKMIINYKNLKIWQMYFFPLMPYGTIASAFVSCNCFGLVYCSTNNTRWPHKTQKMWATNTLAYFFSKNKVTNSSPALLQIKNWRLQRKDNDLQKIKNMAGLVIFCKVHVKFFLMFLYHMPR